jgi:hypothetical protein
LMQLLNLLLRYEKTALLMSSFLKNAYPLETSAKYTSYVYF